MDCLQVLSPQTLGQAQGIPPSASLERCISLLLSHLRKTRVLLVLDNLESLLEKGDVKGRFCPGFEGYGLLLLQIAETAHQSCLLFTSREKPVTLRSLEGKHSPVRSLRLTGLDFAACKLILEEKGINPEVGTEQDQEHLIALYGGNPLVLKVVAETIVDLFGSQVALFLTEEAMVFGGIADLLSEQYARLSALEQSVLRWLAIVQEPITFDELLSLLITPLPRVQLLEALDCLHRRSLIERGKRQGSFTLQAVVLQYVTTLLVAEAVHEIQRRRLDRLIEHSLSQPTASEYVRQAQERLLLSPILANLQSTCGRQVPRTGASPLTPTKETDEIVGTGLAPVQEMGARTRSIDRNEPPTCGSDRGQPCPYGGNTSRGSTPPVSAFSDLFVGVNGASPVPTFTKPVPVFMDAVEELLLSLLDQLREEDNSFQGYGPANLIALLRLWRGNLNGLDLSKLCIRGTSSQ
jgi:hypothetical protein